MTKEERRTDRIVGTLMLIGMILVIAIFIWGLASIRSCEQRWIEETQKGIDRIEEINRKYPRRPVPPPNPMPSWPDPVKDDDSDDDSE